MIKKVSIKSPSSRPELAQDWVSKREGTKRLTIDVPLSLHSRLKIASVKTGKTMGDMVRECIDIFLENQGA